MVPKIWNATDRVSCHFGPFFALLPSQQPEKLKFWKTEQKALRYYHFTHVYHKWQSYDVWFLRYEVWRTEFFVILDHFLPFYPYNNPKTLNFEKLKKVPGDIIILQKCSKKHNHMLYGSSDMVQNRSKCYFSFWAIFYHFTFQTA